MIKMGRRTGWGSCFCPSTATNGSFPHFISTTTSCGFHAVETCNGFTETSVFRGLLNILPMPPHASELNLSTYATICIRTYLPQQNAGLSSDQCLHNNTFLATGDTNLLRRYALRKLSHSSTILRNFGGLRKGSDVLQ